MSTRCGLRHAAAVLLATLLVSALTACSTTSRPQPLDGARGAPEAYWQGKLALKVDARPEPKSYFANFELSGSAREGELVLTSPLGTTLARLSWRPGQAVLRRSSEEQRFDDLDALATQATGTALPIAAMFEWLQGRPQVAQGWTADLQQLDEGRLRAHRELPAPAADLQMVLER